MPIKRKRSLGRERGLSLIEIMVVLGIIMIVAGMSFMNINGALKDSRVTTGYNQVLMTLRRARETAVSERREYRVRLLTPGTECNTQTKATGLSCILLIKSATGDVVYVGILPGDVGYIASTTLPNTTTGAPDGLVAGAAITGICFDIGVSTTCSNEVFFEPDGSAHDINGFVNNGIVYIARSGEVMSSRAITVLGATGRIRGFQVAKKGTSLYWDYR